MNKKVATILSVLIILVFIGYIVYDTAKPAAQAKNEIASPLTPEIPDAWKISREFKVNEGSLKAVTVTQKGNIYLGGDSFVSCYDKELNLIWNVKTASAVTSLTSYGDSIFASTVEDILILSPAGKILNEWGPYGDSCFITSVGSNRKYVAIADAGNKIVYILDKGGEVKTMIGQNDKTV